jgi:lysophospholipase L1-like esterase
MTAGVRVTEGSSVLRWVAIGDSYTIGTSVASGDRWPDQLIGRLDADRPGADGSGLGSRLVLVANHAVNGSTAADVRRAQLPRLLAEPDLGFASLLVGVNDVVRGVPPPRFHDDVAAILDALLGRLSPDRILAVETPDYTVTPMGAAFGEPAARRAGIVAFNAAVAELCAERGILFVDGIFAISTAASTDPVLVATDGLHPSAAQYRRWVVERVEPAVRGLLARP